ncbi:MAG: DUF6527 family protein [Minwuia sp.]|nr:DUF6527 family protein [Minwuia sp.]
MGVASATVVIRERLSELKAPGDIAWRVGSGKDADGVWCAFRIPEQGERPDHMFFIGLDGVIGLLALRPEVLSNGHSWIWNGDLQAPTITPSVNGGPGRWHGWITDGVMR